MPAVSRLRIVGVLFILAAAAHFVPDRAGAQTGGQVEQPKSPGTAEYELAQAAIENHGKVPDSLMAVIGSSKLRHWSNVIAVAWTPDGSLLGSVGGEGCLRLWNADTGEQIKRFKSERTWRGGAPHINSLAFEPSGNRVAVATGTNALRVWDLGTGAETHFLKDDSPVMDLAWHPTRPLLATGGELIAKLWDLSTGKVVRRSGAMADRR